MPTNEENPKFILVTGGVMSSVGKGIITSSLGYVLKEMGIPVTCIKIDPYLNYDAGTMSPEEHGEVFVLRDGGECDLDLGNYERMVDIRLTKSHNITRGKMLKKIIEKERQGGYLGKTLQLIPHFSDFIKETIAKVSKKPTNGQGKPPEVCLIELGGTVGDLECGIFIESMRQMRFELGPEVFQHIHTTFIPFINTSNEQKSKPAQHSFNDLRRGGLSADIIICRSVKPINESTQRKISTFGMVSLEKVINIPDLETVFQVPVYMIEKRLPQLVLSQFGIAYSSIKINHPKFQMINDILDFEKIKPKLPALRIGMIVKYLRLNSDCYMSLEKSLNTAARAVNIRLELIKIDAQELKKFVFDNGQNYLHGILVPGGFGARGLEGFKLNLNK